MEPSIPCTTKHPSTTYISQAARTDLETYEPVFQRTAESEDDVLRMEHAAFGLVTEAGEILDVFKKWKYYGKPIDRVNLVEELSDVFWYCALMAKALGVSFEEVQDLNVKKLLKRYPDKFTEDKAINRDVSAERELLEKQVGNT